MGMSDYLLNKASLSSPSVQPLGYAPEVSRLANQISRQRQRANNPQPEGPGLIQRIFDVVSRPLYASANAVDYTLQGKDALTGAWKGLSGQDKTTYDKVLGDMGLSGGWQRSLAGLGLDVALDPTTYVGAGIVKNTAEGAARKAATEVALTGADEVIGKKAVEKAAQGIYDAGSKTTAVEAAASKEARAKALLNMPGAGNDITSAAQSLKSAYSTLPEKVMNVTHDVTMPEAKTIAKEQAQKTLANKMQQSFDEKLAEGKGKVVLKFAGKDTGIGSTGLYNIGSKAAQLAGKSESLQIINRAFRPVATFKGGTNDLLREAMGHSLFDGEEALKQIKGWFGNSTYQTGGELWGGLSKGERELISHSIEDGTDLSGHLVTTTGRTLEDYKQRAQMIFRNLHATEDELGVSSAKNALDNYVYHSYKGGDKEIKAQFKAARNKAGKVSAANLAAEPGSTLTAVKVPTLKEAADAGLKPETDIMNSLGERTIKSFRGQAHARFMRAVEGEFGVPLASTTKGTALKKKGAGDLGKAMGLKPYDSPHFVNKRAWFDPEIHSSLEAADKLHYNPHFSSEIARHFDKVSGYLEAQHDGSKSRSSRS
jgi:hypothetical protein